MIDYSLGYDTDVAGKLETRTDYFYMSGSAEDLYWTVSYDVESKPDF